MCFPKKALNENPLNGGCGSIIRDSAGYVAGPGAGQMKFSHDAIHTEAIARIQALTAAKNRGMEYVGIDSDCRSSLI
jgi:hypothetical protein